MRHGQLADNTELHFDPSVSDTREHAAAIAGRIVIDNRPRPAVTVLRAEVAEVAATA